MRDLPFDPQKDFAAIALTNEAWQFVMVRPDNAATSLQALIEFARRNPMKVSFASTGHGSLFHLMGEQLAQMTGTQLLHVPYKGTAPMQQALLSGEVTIAFGGQSATPMIKSGRMRGLAVLAPTRSAHFPDIPAVSEAYAGYQPLPSWQGYFGPAALPAAIVNRLNTEIRKALASSEVREKLVALGSEVYDTTPAQADARVRSDFELVGRIVRAAGIKPE
jgi:tripartite-type tricarboxylate transporter receptor subunit TctC